MSTIASAFSETIPAFKTSAPSMTTKDFIIPSDFSTTGIFLGPTPSAITSTSNTITILTAESGITSAGLITTTPAASFDENKKGFQMLLNNSKNSPGEVGKDTADVPQLKISGRKSKTVNNLLQQAFGPAESVRVGEALPFNPIDSEPLQVKKLFTPGLNLPEPIQAPPLRLFNEDYLNTFAPLTFRKRGAKRKFFSKISHSVEKRNARERTRVHTVNQAFSILKVHLPSLRANTKRVSKLKILRTAIDYIHGMKDLLENDNQTSLNNTLRMALEAEHPFNKFASTLQNEEPKEVPGEQSELSKSYQPAPTFTLNGAQEQPIAAQLFTNPTDNLTASSILTQTFDPNQAALLKFPYVGYENLYMRPGASYMPYAAGPSTAPNPALASAYLSDPSTFYYQNMAQAGDYTGLNSAQNVYFT